MFALMMSEDRISMQQRRQEIIEGMKKLPGKFAAYETRFYISHSKVVTTQAKGSTQSVSSA